MSTPRSLQAPRNFCLMRELSELGFRTIIITSDSNHLAAPPHIDKTSKIEVIEGVSVIWLRTLKYVKTNSLRRILSWLDFEWQLIKFPKKSLHKPDVIVCSSLSILTILNGLVLKARFRCRLVFEVRDIWPLTLIEEGGYSRFNPLIIMLSVVEKLGYRWSDVIVGTMPNLIAHVENILGSNFPAEVYCIPMGYDRHHLTGGEPLSSDYIEDYIPKNKFVVTHLGSVGITNSLETLLDCAKSMQVCTEIHFLVVGDGDLREHYMQKYGSLTNVTFAPKVPKAQVQSILAQSNIVYLSVPKSDVWIYGQSLNKIIDYMLSGTPVIASYSGFKSMINEANCGVFIDAEDPVMLSHTILEYYDKPVEELAQIGRRGREWLLEHRNYADLAKSYSKILFRDSKALDSQHITTGSN